MSELATHVEYAKSGRSECVKCHRPIPQGGIRIGRQFHAHHEGQRYYHLKCWTPKDTTRKPVDYIFGFEHLQAKDQIAVNKHAGFADEGAVAASHHVVGVAQQQQAAPVAPTMFNVTAAPASAAPASAAPSLPSATFGGGGGGSSSFSFGTSPTASPTKTSPVKPSLFSQPAVSQPAPSSPGSFSFGGAKGSFSSGSATPLTLTPNMRLSLANTSTLSEALNVVASGANLSKLTSGSMTSDAQAVLSGAYELYAYDGDAAEFVHSVERVLRAQL